MDARLKSSILVDALRFRLDRDFVPYYLDRKGDADAGTLYIQFTTREGAYMFTPQYNFESDKREWTKVFVGSEAEARDYLHSLARTDPDCWHIDIEWRDDLTAAQALLAGFGT